MYFSGKVTNSFFTFLSQCDFDTSQFFEMTPLEIDFLKDPNSWLEAHQVERLLNNIQNFYQHQFMDKDLITTVGHNCVSLKSWGGLEDFLKMFENPEDIHCKLDIFFSYFISPAIEVYNIKETKNSFSFETNFDFFEYPLVTYYFKALLESLPLFLGKELTEVKWLENRVEIFYPKEETLPLSGILSVRKKLTRQRLIAQINLCKKNLIEYKKTSSQNLLNQVLKDLSNLKKVMEQEEIK